MVTESLPLYISITQANLVVTEFLPLYISTTQDNMMVTESLPFYYSDRPGHGGHWVPPLVHIYYSGQPGGHRVPPLVYIYYSGQPGGHRVPPLVHIYYSDPPGGHRVPVLVIIIIYTSISRVVGAPQIISQPVFFPFPPVLHCPLGPAELQACPFPDVVFPPLPLSALSSPVPPEGRSGMSDFSPLSGIPGLSFDSSFCVLSCSSA